MSAFRFSVPVEGGYPVLLEGGAAVLVHKTLARLVSKAECELAAYCYLPERLVGVIVGDAAPAVIDRFLAETGPELARRRPPTAWGVATLEAVEDVREASREALLAPEREGISRSARTYGHSGSLVYERDDLLA